MTQYLVFENQNTAGLGTQKELVVNWSNIKQLRPVTNSKFKIELNNGGNLEFTLSYSASSNSAAFIEAIGKLVKAQANGRVLRVKPKTIGGFVITGITYSAPTEAGVNGSNSVYVKPTGTASENGALLLAGLTEAISKIVSATVPGSNIAMVNYQFAGPGQYEGTAQSSVSFSTAPQYSATLDGSAVLITITSVGSFGPDTFEFNITDTSGNPFTISGTPDFPTPATTSITPSTLIIAPGDYSIASDFILNNLVNVTSLTGQADVNITTSNVKIQSGANSSSNPISIVGLNLVDKSIYVASSLSFVSFKNCTALGTNSFSIEPSGTGSISSRFENCIGAFRSFGGGVSVTASGLFIRCKVASGVTNGSAFGGKGNTSGRFEYCGGASMDVASGSTFIPGNMFCHEGVTCGGFFYYCIGRASSFASNNTGATTAHFYGCIGGNQSFAYRNTNNSGKFYNCITVDSGNQAFGSNPQGGDLAANALYYNCTSDGVIAKDAAGISSKFYNCHAKLSWNGYSAGNNGLAYNCSFGSASSSQGSVSGTGKYRNCLDDTFTIINEG